MTVFCVLVSICVFLGVALDIATDYEVPLWMIILVQIAFLGLSFELWWFLGR